MRTPRDRGNRVRAEHAVCGGLPPSLAYWFQSTVIQTHHFCCWFRSMATSGARTSFMVLHYLASRAKPFSRVPSLGIKTQLQLIHSFVSLSVKASCQLRFIWTRGSSPSLSSITHPKLQDHTKALFTAISSEIQSSSAVTSKHGFGEQDFVDGRSVRGGGGGAQGPGRVVPVELRAEVPPPPCQAQHCAVVSDQQDVFLHR